MTKPKSSAATPPEKYTEASVSRGCKDILALLRGDAYSTEAGFVSVPDPGSEKGWKSRPGGTRTTPGFPDIFCMLPEPYGHTFDYVLTVEAKGHVTPIKPEQWLYAWRAMRRGVPHFIVRSPDAFLTGMAYLGLLPTAFTAPWWDQSRWPENTNFLAVTRIRFWGANHPDVIAGRPMHNYHLPYRGVPENPKKMMRPNSEAEAIAQFAVKRRPKLR